MKFAKELSLHKRVCTSAGIAVACFCGLTPRSMPAAAEVDIRRDPTVAAVETVLPSVVNIVTATIVRVRDPFEEMWSQFWDPYHRRQAPGQVGYSLGSGVIIDEEGYVLTNDHVVRRADKISIKPTMATNIYDAIVIATDPKTDIALLKIQGKPGEKFSAIKFAQDDDLLLGETVLSLGNPFGLGGSVSRGILSAKSRISPKETEQLDIPNWLQTDASINPGSSGGPLVNLRGEMIGLNVAILAQAQGIGFAIPVRRIVEAISEKITPESSNQRLWFGARVRAGSGPLTVTSVQPESPAAKAGLKNGDVIQQVNGKTPKGYIHFNQMLVSASKDEVSLAVTRDGARRTILVHLVPETTYFNADLIQKKLGLGLQELTPKLAGALGVDPSMGLAVSGVDRGSPANSGLQPGYVVTAVDGNRTTSLIDVAKAVHFKKPGENVHLDVLVTQRRGNFISYREGAVDLPVR